MLAGGFCSPRQHRLFRSIICLFVRSFNKQMFLTGLEKKSLAIFDKPAFGPAHVYIWDNYRVVNARGK